MVNILDVKTYDELKNLYITLLYIYLWIKYNLDKSTMHSKFKQMLAPTQGKVTGHWSVDRSGAPGQGSSFKICLKSHKVCQK